MKLKKSGFLICLMISCFCRLFGSLILFVYVLLLVSVSCDVCFEIFVILVMKMKVVIIMLMFMVVIRFVKMVSNMISSMIVIFDFGVLERCVRL